MRVAKTRNMCFVCHTTFFLLNFDHGKVYNYTIAQSHDRFGMPFGRFAHVSSLGIISVSKEVN